MDLVGLLGDAVLTFGTEALDVVAGGIGWLVGLVADLLIVLSAALPDGGIAELPEIAGMWEQGLGWLNWWCPVGQLAAIVGAWVASTIVYFFFKFKLRQLVFRQG